MPLTLSPSDPTVSLLGLISENLECECSVHRNTWDRVARDRTEVGTTQD
jgi:hypothetical protein